MDRVIVLTKDQPDIAEAEVRRLCPSSMIDKKDNVMLVLDCPDGLEKRLAYAREVCRFLFAASETDLADQVATYGWSSIAKGSFAVRLFDSDEVLGAFAEEKLGGMIHKAVPGSKVNLTNPDTIFNFYVHGKAILASVREAEVPTDCFDRRAHLKPQMHPSSMHPRLAKACVNLTGLHEGKISDPFCGTGGVLVEAGLMGLELEGVDIVENMISMCRKNLEHYGLDGNLKVGSAIKYDSDADAVVTDLPYGKNTKTDRSVEEMLARFLEHAWSWKARSMVVMVPSDAEYELKSWKLKGNYTYYLHRSLSKRILVLDR